jgi:hypothetical protein
MCNKAYGWGEVSQRYMTGAFAEDHPTKFVQKMQTACNALYGGEADFVTYDPEDNVCELTIMGRVVHQPVAPASQ